MEMDIIFLPFLWVPSEKFTLRASWHLVEIGLTFWARIAPNQRRTEFRASHHTCLELLNTWGVHSCWLIYCHLFTGSFRLTLTQIVTPSCLWCCKSLTSRRWMLKFLFILLFAQFWIVWIIFDLIAVVFVRWFFGLRNSWKLSSRNNSLWILILLIDFNLFMLIVDKLGLLLFLALLVRL